MLDLEPSAVAALSQWLMNNGLVFGAGLLVGSFFTAAVFTIKLILLRRDGVI